jgi:hypothetical protein
METSAGAAGAFLAAHPNNAAPAPVEASVIHSRRVEACFKGASAVHDLIECDLGNRPIG